MRVKRNSYGVTMFLTDHEFSLIQKLIGNNVEAVWPTFTSGEKRSWSRRIRHGEFLRLDQDKRKW